MDDEYALPWNNIDPPKTVVGVDEGNIIGFTGTDREPLLWTQETAFKVDPRDYLDREERIREMTMIKTSEGTLRKVLGSNERMERVAAIMRSDPLGRGDYTRQDVLVLMEALAIEAREQS